MHGTALPIMLDNQDLSFAAVAYGLKGSAMRSYSTNRQIAAALCSPSLFLHHPSM